MKSDKVTCNFYHSEGLPISFISFILMTREKSSDRYMQDELTSRKPFSGNQHDYSGVSTVGPDRIWDVLVLL